MASPVEEKFVKENLVGKSVFEFGCAPGKLASELVAEGYEVSAVDLYDVDSNEKFTFMKEDIMNVHSDTYFDNVIAVSSFEHCGIESDNYKEGKESNVNYHYFVANKLRSMVSSGGLFIITVPFGHDSIYFVDKNGSSGNSEEILDPSWGFRTFSIGGIRRMFREIDMVKHEVYKKTGEVYSDINSWEKIDGYDPSLYDNKKRAVMCCVFKNKEIYKMEGSVTFDNFGVLKHKKSQFGDGINWDKHVDEILDDAHKPGRHIHHKSGRSSWKEARDLIETDTPKDKLKALDCGCHIGRWIDAIEDYGFEYTGVDQSEKALATARKLRPEGNFVHTFLWDMGFKDEFDFAVTVAVLQHNRLEEQEKIVPKIYEALKPGGIFHMSESTVPSNTKTQRTTQSWLDLLERSGFKLVRSYHKNNEGFDDHYIFIKEKK